MRANEQIIIELKAECTDLIEKVNKLNAFKATEIFYNLDRESKDALYEQSRVMDRYIQLLGIRMELLGDNTFIKSNGKMGFDGTTGNWICEKCGFKWTDPGEYNTIEFIVGQHNRLMTQCK